MTDEKVRLGFAICGSFCTFARTIAQMEILFARLRNFFR